MYAQSQVPCETCKAKVKIIYKYKGVVFDADSLCKICSGEGIIEIEKDVGVAIEKGVTNGHQYKFVGYGDEFVIYRFDFSLVLTPVM